MNKINYILEINDYIKELIWNVANKENNDRIQLSLRQTDLQIIKPYSYTTTIKLIGKSKHNDIEIEDYLAFNVHYIAKDDSFKVLIFAKRKNMDIPEDYTYCEINNEKIVLYPISLENYIRKMISDFINHVDTNIKIALQSKEKIEDKFRAFLDKIGQQYKLKVILNNTVKVGEHYYIFGDAFFMLNNYNIKVEFYYRVDTNRLNISTITLESFRKIGLEESFLEQLILADVLSKIFDDSWFLFYFFI